MSGPGFEIVYRDKLWRLSVSTFRGETRLAIWAHYQVRSTGEWKPCGGNRESPGCIIPLDRAEELAEAVNAIVAQLRSDRKGAA
jgi:hypothetical protein